MPKRSSKASHSSMAVSWACRFIVTVKRSRKPPLSEQHGESWLPEADEADLGVPFDVFVVVGAVGVQAQLAVHEADSENVAADAEIDLVMSLVRVNADVVCQPGCGQHVLGSGVDEREHRRAGVEASRR
jgi:hypothetical protein